MVFVGSYPHPVTSSNKGHIKGVSNYIIMSIQLSIGGGST